MTVTPITESAELKAFCRRMAGAEYVTIDTEFIREKTYWPILCLVQVAGPDDSAVIDMKAPGIDPEPLYSLLANARILKVFHAARQDLEIFFNKMGEVPAPIFDTQVAAMVCGFGDQVGYETVVNRILGQRVDKGSRFADWARRPLTQKQLQYALDDVLHLRGVYESLAAELAKSKRAAWLEEEMATLTAPQTYRMAPEDAWRRLKTRGGNKKFFAVLKTVAAWREEEAQTRDMPRNRIIRDDSLLDIAAHAPESVEALARTRGLQKGFAEGKLGRPLLTAVRAGLNLPDSEIPSRPRRERPTPGIGPLTDLLKVLLKHECEKHAVASRLIASADDLALIAGNDSADVPALRGWRRDLFGKRALALKHGRLALAVDGNGIAVIKTPAAKTS